MTRTVNPLPNEEGAFASKEVVADWNGLTLHRGGEELRLEKAGDRFTVRLAPGGSPQPLMDQLHPRSTRLLAAVGLIEVQVDPAHLDDAMAMVRQSTDVAFASHVYQIQAHPAEWVYLTDELTIQFDRSVDRATIGQVIWGMGLTANKAVPGISQTFVFKVNRQARGNPLKLADELMRRSDVLTAEPNIAVYRQPYYSPTDSDYPQQWYLHHTGGTDLSPGSHIAAEAAWDMTRGLRSVVVAVVDDGFDLNHPDFRGTGKLVFPQDFTQWQFSANSGESLTHGTTCARVAIAEETGTGIVGVAPGCAFMPLRIPPLLDDTLLEEVFTWAAEKGAAVVSCSWGASLSCFPLSLRQRAAIHRAATEGRNGKGCVIVWAAGNANRPLNGSLNEQGGARHGLRGSIRWLHGFANHPDVITVGACTSLGKKAVYSNWGAELSLSAPSHNGIPVVWVPPLGYVPTGPGVRGPLAGKAIGLGEFAQGARSMAGGVSLQLGGGGTSIACALVAGVAALVLSANPNLTAREVRQILQDTTDKRVDADPDPQLGLCKGTYDGQGHSPWFGYGKVNALKAVQAAQGSRPPVRVSRRKIRQANVTPLEIPDFNPEGIKSAIHVQDNSRIQEIQVHLEVEHSCLGDLEIYLLPPQGESILLQGRTLGSQTSLKGLYTLQTTPLLKTCLHQTAAGTWHLLLIDQAPLHTGHLKRWQLDIGI